MTQLAHSLSVSLLFFVCPGDKKTRTQTASLLQTSLQYCLVIECFRSMPVPACVDDSSPPVNTTAQDQKTFRNVQSYTFTGIFYSFYNWNYKYRSFDMDIQSVFLLLSLKLWIQQKHQYGHSELIQSCMKTVFISYNFRIASKQGIQICSWNQTYK